MLNNFNIDNINDATDFYNYIEKILNELIDVLFRISLKNCMENHADLSKFVLMGGKSINTFVKNLQKSFDFDIHLIIRDRYDDESEDEYVIYTNTMIDMFGPILATELNNLLQHDSNFNIMRHYLKLILLKNNLITEEQSNHYLNNILFYYGVRIKPYGIRIKGIFLHLNFKDDLFRNYTNYSNAIPPTEEINEIYYPLCDLDIEQTLNFGISIPLNDINIIDDRYATINTYDSLYYLNIFSLVLKNHRYHNLILPLIL
jgi:hypothetical protein